MALALHGTDSQASSLGPSNSISQHTRPNLASDIEKLLASVDAPPMRPHYLPASVLWYFDNCQTDKTYSDIITAVNSCRPKMNLAIRHPDGLKIPSMEYGNVQHSTDIIVQKLCRLIHSDPRMTHTLNSKPPTKTLVQTLFKAEYRQAIFELKEEHHLLCLCSAHWKADMLIGQAFSQRNDAEGKAATVYGQDPSKPPTLPILQVLDAAPANTAKHSLELSPGPKSPSVLHSQKCAKDDAMLSRQKTTGPIAPPSHCESAF
jgi:hypothetical protein